jgi:hypothetical protein
MAWPRLLVRTVSCFQWPVYVSGSYAEYGVELKKPQIYSVCAHLSWYLVPLPHIHNCQCRGHPPCPRWIRDFPEAQPQARSPPDEFLEGLHHLLSGLWNVHSVKGSCHSTCSTLVLAKPAANCVVLAVYPNSDQEFTFITIFSL